MAIVNMPRQLARQWVEPQPTGWASTTATNSSTWIGWNSSYTATTITVPSWDPWPAWNVKLNSSTASTTSATAYAVNESWISWNVQAESAAQKQARFEAARIERAERERLERARQTERNEIRRVAILRADRLLESILTSVQRDQLKKTGGFVVRGQSGQLYRIREGRSGNVDVVDAAGRVTERLCAHPILDVPDGDTMAAQKLMLECDEGAFLRMAIKHRAGGQLVPMAMLELV